MIGKLNYSLSGEGEKTVVMLHGWGMSSNAFSVLEKQLNSYSKCLIVDFYGFGKSDKPPDYFDTYEYAYQIFLLLKNWIYKKPYWWGILLAEELQLFYRQFLI